MVLRVLIIIAILLQIIAVTVAVRQMKRTKYNVAWILFTFALLCMCLLRVGEWFQFAERSLQVRVEVVVWIGVITSFCFAVGLFYVEKILNYIDRLNYRRQLTDRRILSATLRVEERERLNFSKELHDGLGPLLSSAKMSLSAIDRKDLSASNVEIVDNSLYVINEAVRSLREVSNNLSPHVLQDFGVARALKNFLNRAVLSNNININFKTNMRSERLDQETEVILYRVVCELVNNSIKHSGCSNIEVSLQISDERVVLDYSDNGCGFEVQDDELMGMGLSNINSRIKSLKGNIDIFSLPGCGMKAHIVVCSSKANGDK